MLKLEGACTRKRRKRRAPPLRFTDARSGGLEFCAFPGTGYNCPVQSALRVASPPAKPLMIFDGDCNFCAFWICRWQGATGERVEYLPFQDPSIAARFPELPRDEFERAVQLLEPDGAVYSGAEAACRALAHNPHEQWLLDWYVHSPVFARTLEWGYGFVASHRRFFSALTRLAWGSQVGPPTHLLVRGVFLRAVALIYLMAFVSLWTQIRGLVGSNGIAPAQRTITALRQEMAGTKEGRRPRPIPQLDSAPKSGLGRFHLAPTLCWLGSSDGFLKGQCAAGTALALLVLVGLAPAPCLFLLWLIYLSLCTVCREFLSFQWDILLLETGFLAIFLAPLQLLPTLSRAPPPSRVVLWLLRWLLFRLMFESGCVKLLSGDRSWHDLTALTFHYETQPLPTWVGWYAHQLPVWFQKASTVVMFGIELALPLLIFAPRRLRRFAALTFIVFQGLIFLTGNYCFFNLLTIALCLSLFDDAALQKLLPAKWRKTPTPDTQPPPPEPRPSRLSPLPSPRRPLKWPLPITVPLACIAVAIGLMQLSWMFSPLIPWPRPILALYMWLSPFRSFNSYGLFSVMTTRRPEIVVEGSNDGVTWLEYEFKYKPGDLKRRPKFVAPHQPRLDWQMWFAALSNYQRNPWFLSFCTKLLQGSPEVLALLERNPFPNAPPRYLRALVYDYHFTDLATRRKTGAWWRRELKGEYLPIVSVQEGE
jgi:predicted DCC family thiol-disulfide oxidoreductase YuxK